MHVLPLPSPRAHTHEHTSLSFCLSSIRALSRRTRVQWLILRKRTEELFAFPLSLSPSTVLSLSHRVGGFAQVRFQETRSPNSPVFIHYRRGGEDLGQSAKEMKQREGGEGLNLPRWSPCRPVTQSSVWSFLFFVFLRNELAAKCEVIT